jgi:hypothetical protein
MNFFKKAMGIVKIVIRQRAFFFEFENKCCADRPFILVYNYDGSYACDCGLWCTSLLAVFIP